MKDVSQRVYYAKCIGPNGEPIGAYKIGCSHGHNDRVRQLSANLPFTLEIVASVPGGLITESAVHLLLKPHRLGGEYFKANEQVEKYINGVIARGEAFHHFEEGVSSRGKIAEQAVEGFMAYHGLTEDEVRERLGVQASVYRRQRKQRFGNRKWIAAMAVLLCERRKYSTWPHDAFLAAPKEQSNDNAEAA